MARLQGTLIGSKLTRIVRSVKQAEAGWYIQAALALIEDGVLPAPVPAKYLAGWIAIEEEIKSIRDLRKTRSAMGKMGGRPKANQNQTEPSQNQTKAAGNQTEPNQNQTEAEGEGEGEVNPDGFDGELTHPRGRAKSPSPIGPSGKINHPGQPVIFDQRAFDEDPKAYIAAVERSHLPELATAYCDEPNNARARATYGAYIRDIGEGSFRDQLVSFVSECRSDERPRKPAAAFYRRIKTILAKDMAEKSLGKAACHA